MAKKSSSQDDEQSQPAAGGRKSQPAKGSARETPKKKLGLPGAKTKRQPLTDQAKRQTKAALVKRVLPKLRAPRKASKVPEPPKIKEPRQPKFAPPEEALAAPLSPPLAAAVPRTPVEQQEQTPSLFVDRGLPLPDGYDLDRLVCLPRDPWWLFCYWELRGGKLEQVRQQRGDSFMDACAWVLRLHRLDEGLAVDIEIDPSTGNWYLNVGGPGSYQLELGLLSPEGEWVSLLVSQIVGTPRSVPSEKVDEQWRLQPHEEDVLASILRRVTESDLGSSPRGSAMLGAERLKSSFALVSSLLLVNGASGRPVPGSGAWNFLGASGQVSSAGSGGFGWTVAPGGAYEPALERPATAGGPNWNLQPGLPGARAGKTQQPHFQVKLPRVLREVEPPAPTWPASQSEAAGPEQPAPKQTAAPGSGVKRARKSRAPAKPAARKRKGKE